jgi:hypothetical protein
MKRVIFLLALMAVTSGSLLAQRKKISFGEALKKKWVSFLAKADHRGQKNFKLDIRNLTRDSMDLVFENGRMFVPDGPYQPFVVTRSVVLAMSGSENKDIHLKGYCGNADVGSVPPSFVGAYTTKMGSEEMSRTLTQLQAMHLDDSRQMQSLVWAFTNNHGLERIYVNDERGKQFMEVVAMTVGKDLPNYNIKYEDPSELSNFMFTGVAQNMNARLSCDINAVASVDVLLLDANGKVIKCFKHLDNLPVGNYQFDVDADIAGLAQGQYHLAVKSTDSRELYNQVIEI